MNVVEVPNSIKQYSFSKLEDLILSINQKSIIYIDDNHLLSFDNIDNDNKLIVYYIIYRIIKDERLNISDINSPRNGLAFRDKKSGDIFSIYHAHLKNDMVLIWYVIKNDDDFYELKLEYVKHPDKYDNILRRIYTDSESYSLEKNDYLKNLYKNTYLKENKIILKFLEFIKFL